MSDLITPTYMENELLADEYIHKIIISDLVSVYAEVGKIPVADPKTGFLDSSWVSAVPGSIPDATVNVKGIAKISNELDAITGVKDNLIMTPLKVKKAIENTVASETSRGIVRLCTSEEIITSNSTEIATTPASVKALINASLPLSSEQVAGAIMIANSSDMITLSDDYKAVTPKKLKTVVDNIVNDTDVKINNVNNKFSQYLPLSGGTMTGSIKARYLGATTSKDNLNNIGDKTGLEVFYGDISEGTEGSYDYSLLQIGDPSSMQLAQILLHDSQISLRVDENGKGTSFSNWKNVVFSVDEQLANVKGAVDVRTMRQRGADNPIRGTANDTVQNWLNLGPGVYWYDIDNCLIDQPSKHSFLLNYVCTRSSGLEVFQLWCVMGGGGLYVRRGNSQGWTTSWESTSKPYYLDGTTILQTSVGFGSSFTVPSGGTWLAWGVLFNHNSTSLNTPYMSLVAGGTVITIESTASRCQWFAVRII